MRASTYNFIYVIVVVGLRIVEPYLSHLMYGILALGCVSTVAFFQIRAAFREVRYLRELEQENERLKRETLSLCNRIQQLKLAMDRSTDFFRECTAQNTRGNVTAGDALLVNENPDVFPNSYEWDSSEAP